jgi:hypothetical protein
MFFLGVIKGLKIQIFNRVLFLTATVFHSQCRVQNLEITTLQLDA